MLGGLLTTELNWRWIFLVSLVFGLIESSRRGWGDTEVIGALVIAVVLLVAFPLVERRRNQPMFDLSLFRKSTFVGGSIAAFGINGSLYAIRLYLVLYFQDALHYSALGTGWRPVIITAGSLIVSIPAGPLSARVPVRWLITGAGLLFMRGLSTGTSWTHFILGFLIAGVGRRSGLALAAGAAAALALIRQEDFVTHNAPPEPGSLSQAPSYLPRINPVRNETAAE